MTHARPTRFALQLATLAAALIAGAAALAATSCSVNRRSSALACTTDADCEDGRHCDRGYCVDPGTAGSGSNGCPSRCTSCDLDKLTCQIDCDSGSACGDIDCPTGFDCTIKCNNAQACGDIDCGIGRTCDVTCSGSRSCGKITCDDACKCDVHCGGTNACGDMTCPDRAVLCTHDKMTGSPCDSSVDSLCDLCP